VDFNTRSGRVVCRRYALDQPARILDGIRDLLTDVSVLAFDEACAEEFGKLRGVLKRRRITTGAIDALIAAVALAHDLTVVTHNAKDFQQIPGLRVEDWLAP
jgi:tRNA(fMet)-specific endonuclease VapC